MAIESLTAQCCLISHVSSNESIKCVSISTTPADYGSIKSVGAQSLISTTVHYRDENVVCIKDDMALFDYKRVSTILSQFMGFKPIPDISRTTCMVNPLVRGSARLFLDLTYSKEMTSYFSNCFTALCLMRICPFFPLYALLCVTPIVACESE